MIFYTLLPRFLVLLFLLIHHCTVAELGIRLNGINTDNNGHTRYITYTSIVEYKDDVRQFKNENIAWLVQQAWNEMQEQHSLWLATCPANVKKYIREHKPEMMSAIALKNKIYFASVRPE